MSNETARISVLTRHVVGYASGLAAMLLGLLTLASLGDQSPHYGLTAGLLLGTIALLAVAWRALLETQTPH